MTTCHRCERPLPRGSLFFRFALALEGEAEVIDAPQALPDDPDALVRALEDADADELEAQVHEELAGALCPGCRRELRAFLRVGRPLQ
jgi:hypothetical protein